MKRRSIRTAVLADEAEHVAGDVADLDLITALGDAVAAVVAVDVLELLVPRIAPAAMHLHRPVGGVADQLVALVVAHADLVGEIKLDLRPAHAVRRSNQRTISASVWSSTSGHWIAWLCDSGLPKGLRVLA